MLKASDGSSRTTALAKCPPYGVVEADSCFLLHHFYRCSAATLGRKTLVTSAGDSQHTLLCNGSCSECKLSFVRSLLAVSGGATNRSSDD
jgi:hypothetical protein